MNQPSDVLRLSVVLLCVADEVESHAAFVKHFEEQVALFGEVVILSLAEMAGKEQVVGDAYLAHVLMYNSPTVTYITFDFHEYWSVCFLSFFLFFCYFCCCFVVGGGFVVVVVSFELYFCLLLFGVFVCVCVRV